MTPSEIDVPQEPVVNFHDKIIKAIPRMMSTIKREFDIIVEELNDCDLLFKVAKKGMMQIATLTIS